MFNPNEHGKGFAFSRGLFGTGIFVRRWTWFTEPRNESDVALSNFYSYWPSVDESFEISRGVTSLVRLDRPEEELWEGLRKKYTREPIREGEREGIVIERSNDYKEFARLSRLFRRQKGIPGNNPALFRYGELFCARYQGELIAGHLFLTDGMYYRSWITASSRLAEKDWKRRRLIGDANRMLLWAALRHAKESKCLYFDMGGLSKGLLVGKEPTALDEFKESFGGMRTSCYFYHKAHSPLLRVWLAVRSYVRW